ncbi:uncharacterized protein LOC124118947 [Haliotis rufescens]|uniref:uncharacterized protein LOC124118947 n=1 Tax=Haliotis rufescens TaxID=6454 RepID=UPI001EAFCF03|nr:uncharacterized protein LOC124118947 [Haliotis rufescens]XP_046337232.1 uncharacterized protein LOC124118947 [Haliotis rufescens]XP_046337233.1 uncharacterized protein LOC124118947 [Haliotis rufescens]XP_046337234.1 uncharacterized protein LOC124118947 [Haliotis rufescens]
MIIERKTMNILFYLGIIVPTIITVILFVLFIVCWYRLKARREVLHKKHDPHGKMRQLGVSRVPPPPPVFIRQEFQRLSVIGEDNDAYQVSRSPSTEQDHGARPGLYHAPHDSGLSELSEFQCKDRPHSQASQGSTDSEDSGFRSSRSGQYHPSANNQLQDIPLLKPIKSNKGALETVRLPPSDNAHAQSQMQACARPLNSSTRNINSSARHFNTSDRNLTCAVKNLHSSRNLNSSCRTMNNSSSFSGMELSPQKVNLTDISTHISWMYLQNLATSPTAAPHGGGGINPTVTMAQVHCSSGTTGAGAVVESNGDLLGYSVV